MTVLDYEDYGWFLLSKEERLFLDVNCNHSFVGYSFLIELDEAEVRQYRQEGRDFIVRLADRVQHSGPGVRGSKSEFKNRGVENVYGKEVVAAIQKYRASKWVYDSVYA